jgi:hypothetical protein
MTHAEATRILDMSKEGVEYPIAVIVEALAMCGDTDHATQIPDPEMQEFVEALRQSGAL